MTNRRCHIKNSDDRAFPVAAVAYFDHHVTKSRSLKFKILNLLDRPDSTEIRSFINMMNCSINLCTHDSSVCAPYVLISSYGQA